jgi:hypothetical protein
MNQPSKYDFLRDKLDTQQSENSSTQNSESLTSQQPENSSIQNSENTKSEGIEVKESKTLVGRPRGKRSNPDYSQVTSYIKKETHKSVQRVLLEKEKEFSELIQELLEEWLAVATREQEQSDPK